MSAIVSHRIDTTEDTLRRRRSVRNALLTETQMIENAARRENTGNRPTCVELFAGAGGMALGLENAGFRTLLANEVHPHPCMTLRRNFDGVPVVEGSIRDLGGRELLEAAGYDWNARPEIDLIAGGPPCQGFSTAGLKDKADPRNTLIYDFIRIVRDLRPRAFLLENVTGLATMHDGKLFERVLDELDVLGYKFHFQVLFAADHGVPQMRKRLIVLGAREETPPPHPEQSHRRPGPATLLNMDLPTYTTCGDALGDLPDIDQGESTECHAVGPATWYQSRMRAGFSGKLENHQASKHRPETTAYYALVPPGGTWLDIPKEFRKAKQGMQRWPLEGLARTVTTEPTDFLHPTLDRIPTVRELARIQSFPDHFVFLGQRTTGNKMRRLGYCSQTQQVGNAVPPMLAEAVGSSILESWSSRV
jgi:DNA (cytosine-5)-methyltransferase 1